MWLIIDEGGEEGAGAYGELARWKMVGCKFLICGDFDGQLLPMFDRWADVYNEKGILKSRILYDLANGLSCNLAVCRRTLGDQAHFYAVKELYNRRYFRPGEPVDKDAFAKELRKTVAEYAALYRIDYDPTPPPDVVATMSHKHRLMMNAILNIYFADQKTRKKWLPWTRGDIPGATMQPQSCHVWPGIVLMGCTRGNKGREGDVTNGVNYVLTDFDEKMATVQMHPDYAKNYIAKVERNFPKLESVIPKLVEYLRVAPRTAKDLKSFPGVGAKLDKGLTVLSALKSVGFVEVDGVVTVPARIAEFMDNPEVEPSAPDEIMGPEEFQITWTDLQQCLRLTHALPYVYHQGKTVANQTLWLMSVTSPHFTMRHLILGLGRVQTAKNVRICARSREERLLDRAREALHLYESKARSEASTSDVVAAEDVSMDEQASVLDPFDAAEFDDADDEDPFENEAFDDADADAAAAEDPFEGFDDEDDDEDDDDLGVYITNPFDATFCQVGVSAKQK